MLLITCPYCGQRDESEFACGGEAHIARPLQTDALGDETRCRLCGFAPDGSASARDFGGARR